MDRIKFFDENTQQWWTPVTGGSNIPALNDLLFPFGLGFSDEIFAGTYTLPGVTLNGETRARDFPYLSGTALARFPPDARILSVSLHDQVAEVTQDTVKEVPNVPILALVEGKLSILCTVRIHVNFKMLSYYSAFYRHFLEIRAPLGLWRLILFRQHGLPSRVSLAN